jgi:hypothetical protein
LVRKSMETKSKMATVSAILDEWQSWSSKGTFLQSPPISDTKIGSIDPGVCPVIDGNQIQDSSHSGHLRWAAELIVERNLPLVTPNEPQKNQINRPWHLSYNWRKPNVYENRCIGHDIMPRHFIIGGIKIDKRGKITSDSENPRCFLLWTSNLIVLSKLFMHLHKEQIKHCILTKSGQHLPNRFHSVEPVEVTVYKILMNRHLSRGSLPIFHNRCFFPL